MIFACILQCHIFNIDRVDIITCDSLSHHLWWDSLAGTTFLLLHNKTHLCEHSPLLLLCLVSRLSTQFAYLAFIFKGLGSKSPSSMDVVSIFHLPACSILSHAFFITASLHQKKLDTDKKRINNPLGLLSPLHYRIIQFHLQVFFRCKYRCGQKEHAYPMLPQSTM